MLPLEHRLRTSDEFRSVVRDGVRVGRRTVVVHARRNDDSPLKAGFVVSKAVGGAVQRNRVKRQLRHMVSDRLPASPPVSVVVRALPAATSGPLAADFASAWDAALAKLDDAA